MNADEPMRFAIDASVVFQLGEKLISDEVQALVELVKNSYDADANYVNLTIATNEIAGNNSRHYPQSTGYILIEDDGTGMNEEEIIKGWLTISASPKREFKAQGKITGKGRTPLGDKGLGRLGSQRLGNKIEMWTCKKGSNEEIYVGFDWNSFKGQILSKVDLFYEKRTYATGEKARKGTRILISDLHTPEKWRTGKSGGQDKLIQKLSTLISPFSELQPSTIYLSIDGKRIDLDKITKNILDASNVQVSFSYRDGALNIRGKLRLNVLFGTSKGAKEQYQQFLAVDSGADFFAYLNKSKTASIPKLKWADKLGWFIFFEESRMLQELEPELLSSTFSVQTKSSKGETSKSVAEPGQFSGAIYSFALRGNDELIIDSVFDKVSEFSGFIKKQSGIRVFRDGFGIRPYGVDGNDWLKLGAGWTSATSYYGLRPSNTIGYVALSAKNNKYLEETTDREGFVDNPYSYNFFLLMKQVVKTSNHTIEVVRREYNKFVKFKSEQKLNISSEDTGSLINRIRETASESSRLEIQVQETRKNLEHASLQVKELVVEVNSSPLFYSPEERKVTSNLTQHAKALDDATKLLKNVELKLIQAKQLAEVANILEPDLIRLREELEQFSELAGLGLIAEALVHEISIIVDNLAERTRALLNILKDKGSSEPYVVAYTERVYTAISRIRKQISHLDSSLHYVSEEQDIIKVSAFFEELRDFYNERFNRNNIELIIEQPIQDFEIRMNKGKLTQIIDNLLLNSEYWLIEGLRQNNIPDAKIIAKIKAPLVEIYDTGQGIAESIENYLFQPFVTTKPVGRGLGLFITRQLLDPSNCTIALLPDRNQFGQRYIFRIDFRGAIND